MGRHMPAGHLRWEGVMVFVAILGAVVVISGAWTPSRGPLVADSLAVLSAEVTSRFFLDCRCVVTISDVASSVGRYALPELPTFHIRVYSEPGTGRIVTTDSPLSFHGALLNTLDQGCLGYVVHVKDPEQVVKTFAEVSRKGIFRANRKYLYLPLLSGEDGMVQTENLFSMKEMDFMPDLIAAQIVTHEDNFTKDKTGITEEGEVIVANGIPEEVEIISITASRNDQLIKKEQFERDHYKPLNSKGQAIEVFIRGISTNRLEKYPNSINLDMVEKPAKLTSRNIKETEKVDYLNIESRYEESTEEILDINLYLEQDKQEGDFEIQLLTHMFVGDTPYAVKLLDTWSPNSGFLDSRDLFPDKISNLQGKQLTFVSFDYPPYTIVNATAEPPVFAGTEFSLMDEFVKARNLSWRLVSDDNKWGVVWSNGSGNGLSGFISQDRADLGFGSMYLWYHEFQFLDFTTPYYRTAVTCLVPKPKPMPGWMVPLLPFTAGMWLAVGVSLSITAMALYWVSAASYKYLGPISGAVPTSMYSSLSSSWLLSLGMLLLQTPAEDKEPHSPRYAPLRHLVAWLMVLFLLITSSYSGGLSSVLTVPRYERPVDTIEDLAASGFHWAANHEAWVFSIKEATEPALQRITHNFQVLTDEQLAELSTGGELAYGVERLAGGNFALGPYLDQASVATLRLMAENLYWGNVALIARKGSPYMDTLNSMVGWLRDSGSMLHLESKVVRQFLSQTLQQGVQYSAETENPGPTKLALSHVQGAFILLLLGLGLALLAFLAELAVRRSRRC